TSINEFKYIIEIQGKPLFEGAVQENIQLSTNENITVPLTFRANIFGAAKEKGFDKLLSDILTRKSDAFLALKIKPSVRIGDRKSTRLNSSHVKISYAVFCLKKKNKVVK